MKLDIMTLMAASAAVSDSPRPSAEATLETAGEALDGSQAEGSFIAILQSLAAPAEAEVPVLAASETKDQPDVLVGEALIDSIDLTGLEPDSGTPLAVQGPLWISGQNVPLAGAELPGAMDPEEGADSALLLQRSERSAAAALNATDPAASPAGGQAAVAAASTTNAPTLARAAGWYSRTADEAAATAPTSAASIEDASTLAARAEAARGDAARLAAQEANSGRPAPAERTFDIPAAVRQEQSALAQLAGRLGDSAAPLLAPEPIAEGPRAVGALAAANASTAAAAASAPDRTNALLSLQRPGWDRAFADQLTVMASRGVETAELKLDPPSLGTVHVKLTLQGDQAQLLVQSANGAVRDLMETALPRLRELLGNEGLSLDHAQVADREQPQRQQRESDERLADAEANGDEAREEPELNISNDTDLTLGPGRLHIRV